MRPLSSQVEPRQPGRNGSESVADERLIEHLGTLGRMIDPVPWIVEVEAEELFARAQVCGDHARCLCVKHERGPCAQRQR